MTPVTTLQEAEAYVGSVVNRTIVDSARRFLDDLLSSADGTWHDIDEIAAKVTDYLDRAEASREQSLADLRSQWPAMVAALNQATDQRGADAVS